MAKVTFGPIISEARGNCGDVNFSRNRGGSYSRAKLTRVAAWSTAQLNARSYHNDILKAWVTDLTDTQRLAWNAFALTMTEQNQLKNASPLSGIQWFARVAYWYWEAEGHIPYTPPTDLAIPMPPTPTITRAYNTPARLTLLHTPTLTSGQRATYAGTKPLSPGISNPGERFCQFLSISDTDPNPFEAAANYLGVIGPLTPAKKLFVEIAARQSPNWINSVPLLTWTTIDNTPPGNLLLNPDFETGTPGNQAPDWTHDAGNGLLITTDYFQHGSQSAKTDNPTPADSYSHQDFTPTPPGNYTFAGWIRATALTGAGLGLLLQALALPSLSAVPIISNTHPYQPNPTLSIMQLQPSQTPTDWQYCEMTYTMPPGQTGTRVYLELGGGATIQGTIWIDNLWLGPAI